MLKQYLENETRLRVEEEVGNIDEFDGKTQLDKEMDLFIEEVEKKRYNVRQRKNSLERSYNGTVNKK